MESATRIRIGRRPVRITSRKEERAVGELLTSALEPVATEPTEEPSVVDLVKSSDHLIRIINWPEQGRDKHQDKDVLRMVARFLFDSGKEYPQAEVLTVLRCFTGCGQGAAGEALQVLLFHNVVTAVNEVIRVTW
jgi:hypothetical protein